MRYLSALTRVLLVAAAVLTLVVPAASAGPGQDESPDNEPAVADTNIVPKPNSGTEPTEAGDRGGALQLMIPLVIVAALGGGVWHVSRQARANRERAAL